MHNSSRACTFVVLVGDLLLKYSTYNTFLIRTKFYLFILNLVFTIIVTFVYLTYICCDGQFEHGVEFDVFIRDNILQYNTRMYFLVKTHNYDATKIN